MRNGYEQIIHSLLHRVGGYISIPKVERQKGQTTFHIREADDGALHLWLPGKNRGDR